MKIAMLLDGAISNDHRVIKMIKTLSTANQVDLYCLDDGKEIDHLHFKKSVRIFKFEHKMNFKTKLLRHSYFCFEYNFFHEKIIDAKIDYDFIWANDLPTLLPAHSSAKKLNAKLIYDSHEIYIETINQFFPLKSSFPKSILFNWLKKIMKNHGKRIENKLIQTCDQFVTVNDSLMKWFKNEYKIQSGLTVMNMPKFDNTELIPFDYKKNFAFDENDKVLLYQGNLNQGRGLHFLAQMTHVLPKEFKMVFIGNGPLKKTLQANCLASKTVFINTVSIDALANYTTGADIGINFLEPLNLSKKMASPNKLFEYIHALLPILATEGQENRKIIDKYQVGVLCDLNETSFLVALEKFSANNSHQFIENCKKAKSSLKWDNQEEAILNLLSESSPLPEKN